MQQSSEAASHRMAPIPFPSGKDPIISLHPYLVHLPKGEKQESISP
jgi:hypothetical protein